MVWVAFREKRIIYSLSGSYTGIMFSEYYFQLTYFPYDFEPTEDLNRVTTKL